MKKHTIASIKALLTSDLDTVEEFNAFGRSIVVQFNGSKAHGSRAVTLHVRDTEVSVGGTSCASYDFLGTADAYTRAAAFVRAVGLPLKS